MGVLINIIKEEKERLERLLKYYESNGFFDAAINLESECKSETLSKLKIQISENKISEIKRINYSGDPLPKIISTKEIAEQLMDQIASEKLVKETEASIIKKLRNEGYISSRVNFKYSTTEDGINKVANINIYLGRPVSFTFIGNTVFGAAEFLDTINLFSRKLPLGSNTINLLVDAIEKKYRDSGYLYASINQEKIINPDGRIDYIIRIKEESQIDVKSVIFEGNLKIGNQKLELLLKETDPLLYEQVMHPKYVQAESIESNINALKDIYHSEGYPETTVDYRIDQLSENNSVNIVYQIKEGKEQKADWLDISGLPEDIELNKDIQGSYSIESANQKLDQFLNELQNLGYYEASFSSEFDFNNKKLKVEFIPGPPTLIQSIEIQGNEKIKDAVIYKHLLFKAGDYWNNNKILESRKKLLKLGLFSKVEISAKNAQIDSRNEPLIIRVIERPLQSLEIGAGANSALGTHIFAQATDRSLFKDGKSISLINDIYYDPRESGISQGIAGLVYTHPELFNSDYTLTEDLRYQKLDTSAQEFDLDRASLASYVYKNYNENLTLSLGHSILDENLTNVAQDAIISNLDEGNVRLSFISGFITLDKRDVPLNAKNGYVLNFDYKLSSQALASQADFYSLGTRASYVTPLENIYDKLSFAANSRLASSWTFADTNEVPISQRFYTGGRSSIRGYRENSLGPRGKDGSIIGGDTLVVNNFELRYLAASNTSLISFFDAGTVFLKDQSNSIGDIRTSVGIGVRLISPIGPIGFDIGHALDEKPGEPSVRFHFNIGSNF